ncbi:MAG: hypothetical protein U0W40_05435 [Acidimicrobiia bacterium]
MRIGRCLLIAATGTVALALTAGAAGAQTTPTSAEVNRAKAALLKFEKENAPKSEKSPTELTTCPFGDNLVIDLARQQDDFVAGSDDPEIVSTVFVDQTFDKGTRSIPCTARYTTASGDTSGVNLVVYADPKIKTAAYGKALAKAAKGKSTALIPPTPNLLGGKLEGYCVKSDSPDQCAYVWNRNGLYVEIDGTGEDDVNFTQMRDVVLSVLSALPDISVGVN